MYLRGTLGLRVSSEFSSSEVAISEGEMQDEDLMMQKYMSYSVNVLKEKYKGLYRDYYRAY